MPPIEPETEEEYEFLRELFAPEISKESADTVDDANGAEWAKYQIKTPDPSLHNTLIAIIKARSD